MNLYENRSAGGLLQDDNISSIIMQIRFLPYSQEYFTAFPTCL